MPLVIKATGQKEEFSEKKVRDSIKRAGIADDLTEKVVEHVKGKLYDGIKTSEIYHHIVEFLGKSDKPHFGARYGLKQALMRLGPTGYPFEDFFSDILKTQGFITKVRQILHGKCVTHEVDVVARNGANKLMVEAKFHNAPGIKTDVHVALYTKARFDDVLLRNDLNQAWLVTNTKVTEEALIYAICVGMKVTSWNYPNGESLRELIEKANLTPITALTSISSSQQQTLLENRIVVCKDICKNPNSLNILDIPQKQKDKVLEEASFVCNLNS